MEVNATEKGSEAQCSPSKHKIEVNATAKSSKGQCSPSKHTEFCSLEHELNHVVGDCFLLVHAQHGVVNLAVGQLDLRQQDVAVLRPPVNEKKKRKGS
jgi:hypothetical protein